MPEGDTIFRTATQLRKVLDNQVIDRAESRFEIPDADSLAGLRVTEVEPRGKHLLIHFEDGRVLHSHMGMTGAWHIYRPEEAWQKSPRGAAMVLRTERFVVVCFRPKQIELIPRARRERDEYLSRLGPDLLADHLDGDAVVARFRKQNPVAIGHVIMNQTVVSGVGNVYKSEVLFLEQIHPLTKVAELTDAQLLAVVERAQSLMRRNLDGYPRRTRFETGGNVWVYHRRGSECLKCGAKIEMLRQGDLARSTYYCPQCQPQSAELT